ncbi:MAG TPA: rhamnan synthesis F family protein [Patescibacteria group bacterium]|nr:rhamnan synthesis F family protein [Patescibacteria group bacterium]
MISIYDYLFRKKKQQYISQSQQKMTPHSVAVVLHMYYPDLWSEIRDYLDNIPEPFDLHVTISEKVRLRDLRKIVEFNPDSIFYQFINRGRDIAPFLQLMHLPVWDKYKAVCKIHTKKSPHIHAGLNWNYPNGTEWRKVLYGELLGSREQIRTVLNVFHQNTSVGLIAPQGNLFEYGEFVGANRQNIMSVQEQIGIREADLCDFCAGSMFWFRPESLGLLRAAKLGMDDFPPEQGNIDGTLAHAIERLFTACVRKKGYRVITTAELNQGSQM